MSGDLTLAKALATLPSVTDWRDVTGDAYEFPANGARALKGRGEWTWLVVQFPLPDGTGNGYDGTASRGGTVVHLRREVACEAFLRGDAAVRGERWVS